MNIPAVPRGALRIDEAAAYLGVSRSYNEHADIPRVRLGRRVVYRIVDLDNYLAQRCDLDVAS
jgi:predicted DNA-binding transcriptional regulator AlpA